jgi:hypothetical protein
MLRREAIDIGAGILFLCFFFFFNLKKKFALKSYNGGDSGYYARRMYTLSSRSWPFFTIQKL